MDTDNTEKTEFIREPAEKIRVLREIRVQNVFSHDFKKILRAILFIDRNLPPPV